MIKGTVIAEHISEGRLILFIRDDAHIIVGGSKEGWFKMLKRRFHLEFVHYSGKEKKSIKNSVYSHLYYYYYYIFCRHGLVSNLLGTRI